MRKTRELYKRFRPRTLDQLVGNKAVVATLKNMVERGTLPHTIMLTGPSGSGKTSCARIIRRALRCGLADYRELNLADFRGIDTIREIARTMTLNPIGGRCRVYLLDEAHQLSKDGQNAALKVLEDTPNHVYFILCTTDPGKLLKTIRTRCCELHLQPLDLGELEGLVKRVSKEASIKVPREVVSDIAKRAGGSARTALVLLDKVANLSEEEMLEALKHEEGQERQAIELCQALIINGDPWTKVARIVKGLEDDPEQLRRAVLGYAKSVLLNSAGPKAQRAYNVLVAFENDLFSSGLPGLVRACYEAVNSE